MGVAEWAAIELRYGGYIERERECAAKLAGDGGVRAFPESLEFPALASLSYRGPGEARPRPARPAWARPGEFLGFPRATSRTS